MSYVDSSVDAAAILTLLMPWLPGATVDELRFSDSCGCYSEYTQEPCFLDVTLKAPRPVDESTAALGKQVSVWEGILSAWAQRSLQWTGCECCEGDGHVLQVNLRVIPVKR